VHEIARPSAATSRFLPALVALAGLLAACATAARPPAQPENTTPPTATVAAERPTVVGHWREFWGTPGETDVDYHDEYQVGYDGGRPFVLPVNQEHADDIQSVTIDGDTLDLVIRTAFEVHYQLRLDPGGATMSGHAITPDKTVPIRWERISD
jgi:hypothetical protein